MPVTVVTERGLTPLHWEHKICFSFLLFNSRLPGDTEAVFRHKRATFLRPCVDGRKGPPRWPGSLPGAPGLWLPVVLPVKRGRERQQQFPDYVTVRTYNKSTPNPSGSRGHRRLILTC